MGGLDCERLGGAPGGGFGGALGGHGHLAGGDKEELGGRPGGGLGAADDCNFGGGAMCIAGGNGIWDVITSGLNALIGGGERALPRTAAFATAGGGGGGLGFCTRGSIPVLGVDGSQSPHPVSRRDLSPLCSLFALALGGDLRVGV